MLIRKAVFSASVFSGLFGVSQADAGTFGRRNCCQATPVVCPPCAVLPGPITTAGIQGWLPAACVQLPTTVVSETVVSPSPFANHPRMRISQDITIQRQLSDGSIVQETRQQTRELTQSEEVRFLVDELQKLDRDVFGNNANRPQPLETRVDQLEQTKP